MFEPGHLHRSSTGGMPGIPEFSVDVRYDVRNDPAEGAMLHFRMTGEIEGKPFADEFHVNLGELYESQGWGYRHTRFRPVAKRSSTLSINDFLVIKDGGYEEPRRVVEPVKEGAA